MSVDAIWKPAGLRLDTADFSGVAIGGLTQYDVGDSPNVKRDHPDGQVYPTRNSIVSREEAMNFTTINVDDAIDAIGFLGQCFQGDNTHGGFRFFLARQDECGFGHAAGSVHRTYGVGFSAASPAVEKRGLVTFQSLTCDHQGDAQYALKVDPRTASSQSYAIEVQENQALPAIIDNGRRYTLGPMTVGGILIEGKKNLNITSGINVFKESADSNISAEWTSINTNDPVITIRGIDPRWRGLIPASGMAFTHANTSLYLRRRGDTSGVDFEPDGDAKHIKLTSEGLAVVTTIATGNQNSPSETALVLYPNYNGTTVPIVGLTGQAIT